MSLVLVHFSPQGSADPPRDPPAVPQGGAIPGRDGISTGEDLFDGILVECHLQVLNESLINQFRVKVVRAQPIMSAQPQVWGLMAQSKSFPSILHK